MIKTYYQKEITSPKINLKKGVKGNDVKKVQEWLCLHGINIAIDKDFGPATDSAVKQFQKKKGLKVDGIVGKNTFGKLTEPMYNTMQEISKKGKSLGELVVDYAIQHLNQNPREIGGQNIGPWVRLYMKGYEGKSWPWCAGFVSFILTQSCESLNKSLPIKASFSCDLLASNAKLKGIFKKGSEIHDKTKITPGSIFLRRRTSNDWTHTGIVIKAEKAVFHTIEGNTNDEGSREGYEVCRRIRSYTNRDFILIK